MKESPSKPAFFDNYPRFYETGNTGAGPRLNARHDCLIARHIEYIRDRTLLDVGSHDGRWSFAGLSAGAKKVIGIEPRAPLVEASNRTFPEYGIARDRFAFHVGDAFEILRRRSVKVDTVFLFGIFYHVQDHVGLLQELWHTGAKTIIVDTAISPDQNAVAGYENTISLVAEKVGDISNSPYEIFPGAGTAIVGYPSRRAVLYLLRAFQFEVAEVSWAPLFRRWGSTGLEDYAAGQRATFLARKA